MKRLIIACLAVAMLACEEEKPKIDYAILSGKIQNPAGESVNIYKGRDLVKKIALSEDGTFSDTLKIENGYYRFNHGREGSEMYLSTGDELKVELNTKEFDESITYSGIGSESNNFLAAKYLAEEKFDLNFAELYAMEEAEFLGMMNEVKSSKVEFLKAAENITPALRDLEKKNIEYQYLTYLQNYQPAHRYYSKNEDFVASDDFIKTLEDVDYSNEEEYNSSDFYKTLAQRHYASKISDSDNPAEVFKTINESTFPALKQDLANMLNYEIGPNNKHNEDYYNGLMAMSSDDKYKEALTSKYDKIKKLTKGMPSPKFVEYEKHGGGVTSLDDLKGKYVYIDVWATWCGPCIREIPSLKEVEKQYHGKNIAFVSTSIDRAKDHNTWVEMVKEKQLGGTQLMADNDWNSQFVKDYAIEGIPRFILVDPDGNIVSADAPRPSSPKLIEMFDELSI